MAAPRSHIASLTNTIRERRRTALAAAAIFHLFFALGVFGAGRLGLAPYKFDRDGIGQFATDGHLHKEAMESLVSILKQGEFRSWFNSTEAFHVKIYSLIAVLTSPLLGSNILTIEPLNLLCYLAILVLTFRLARIIVGLDGAWLATLIVAFWPSLLLHTTQFLRDPLVLVAILALMNMLVITLKEDLNWRRALGAVVAGSAAIYVDCQTRPQMWLVITAIVFLSTLLLILKIAVARKILAVNLLVMASLVVISIGMPRRPVVVHQPLSLPPSSPAANPTTPSGRTPIWWRIAMTRKAFIFYSRGSGSLIDQTVFFNSLSDIIEYVPRALEIGYFAPFPNLWFKPGTNVGLIGRIISGVETMLTYLLEALACFFVWQTRKNFTSWLLAFTTMIGMLALGLVVANLGTLYRIRYPFWILLVIMATGSMANWYGNRRPTAAKRI